MNGISFSYVALIDVLGYKSRLEADRRSGVLTFRDALVGALEVFNSINENEFQHEAISDTIIIRCPFREKVIEMLNLIKEVQISFLKHGLFTRGAVVYQQHFQSGKITYSLALSQAHHIESNQAIYPRVVVDRNIIDMFRSEESESAKLSEMVESRLLIERNGVYFVNLIDSENWLKIRSYVARIFESDRDEIIGNEGAFSKHVWFEDLLFSSSEVPKLNERYIPPARFLG